MSPTEFAAPVVVGIDGSPAAVEAALWAVDEAVSRGVTLRLVHVVDVEADLDRDLDEDPSVVTRDWPETQKGLAALREASVAVRGGGKPVHVETELLWGEVEPTLIAESARAAMMCVGSSGISPVCQWTLGSTAATVAGGARSAVAVIRTPHVAPPSEPDWIVAVVDDLPDADQVVEYALTEGHLRHAPVLALGVARRGHRAVHYDELERRVASWRCSHQDVHVYPVSAETDAASFLAGHDELSVQLTVLGSAEADQTPAIVGPHRPSRHLTSRGSVLVVR